MMVHGRDRLGEAVNTRGQMNEERNLMKNLLPCPEVKPLTFALDRINALPNNAERWHAARQMATLPAMFRKSLRQYGIPKQYNPHLHRDFDSDTDHLHHYSNFDNY